MIGDVFKPGKSVLQLSGEFFDKLGVYVKKWVKRDMEMGKCQRYEGGGSKYKSVTYKKYKSNFMNRLGTGESSGKKLTKSGKLKNLVKGTKIKAYEGRQVRSNITTQVNMMLTGETINGLRHLPVPTQDHVLMMYQGKDSDKILGNEVLGRYITTLSEENQKKVNEMIEIAINKQWLEFCRTKTVINVT